MNIAQIKQIDLVDYLRAIGFSPAKESDKSAWYQLLIEKTEHRHSKSIKTKKYGMTLELPKVVTSLIWQNYSTKQKM